MSMGVIAGLIRGYVNALRVLDSVSFADSRFHAGPRRAGNALVSSLQRHIAWKIKDINEIGPAQRRFLGYRWNAEGADGDVVAPEGDVWPPRTDGAGRCSSVTGGGRDPAAGKMTSQVAATLGLSGHVAAGLMDSGGLGRCRARLRSFQKILMTARTLVAGSLLVIGHSSGR